MLGSSSTTRMWAVCVIVYLSSLLASRVAHCGAAISAQWKAGNFNPDFASGVFGFFRLHLSTLRDGHGQLHHHTRADRLIGFHAHRTAVLFHDLRHDCQSQPGSTRLGGEIRKEQLLLVFGAYARAGIADLD